MASGLQTEMVQISRVAIERLKRSRGGGSRARSLVPLDAQRQT